MRENRLFGSEEREPNPITPTILASSGQSGDVFLPAEATSHLQVLYGALLLAETDSVA